MLNITTSYTVKPKRKTSATDGIDPRFSIVAHYAFGDNNITSLTERNIDLSAVTVVGAETALARKTRALDGNPAADPKNYRALVVEAFLYNEMYLNQPPALRERITSVRHLALEKLGKDHVAVLERQVKKIFQPGA